MTIEYTRKQQYLMESDCDITLYGGARGGGKTFSVSGNKAILHVREYWTAEEVNRYGIDITSYREVYNEALHTTCYYKFSIDYPNYLCVIVRKNEPQLMATIHPECKKVYPEFGGEYNVARKVWTFPSGAQVMYKSCEKEAALEYFKSANFHMLIIEELTEFPEEWVEIMEGGCRSTDKILKAMKVYTTNPGGKGHKWVKNKFVKNCPALPDGPKVFLEEFNLTYQPLKPNAPQKTKTGETYLFIPSLIFDNPYLLENDKNYVRNLMGKNEVLRQMWLFGNWDVIAGQFFDMFDYAVHVANEYKFFGAKEGDNADLTYRKERFNWSAYRLFRGYDYGYAETKAWTCVFLALNKYNGDMTIIHTIKMSKLTAKMQAIETNRQFKYFYELTPEDIERECADPKSFWQNMDTGDTFMTPWDYYTEQGICLQPSNNDRINGANAMLEAFRIREDGTAQLTILDNNAEFIEDIANLPIDQKNPNDVDTKADDHYYDACRYIVYGIKEDFSFSDDQEKRKSWRDDMEAGFAELQNVEGLWKAL